MSLEVKNISVIYRDGDHSIQALEDVNLKLEPGRCLALVGESGSGKTTLGTACLGLLPGNAEQLGQIIFKGRKIDYGNESDLNQLRWKRVAMVFQSGTANLNPVHRIIDQVGEPLIQHEGLSREKAGIRASIALEKMGLPESYHGRYPHQLSGGQAQRALLAMAMILDPEVLILDEPTSALDALTKGFVSNVIEEAKSKGKALFLITHDLEFAVRSSDIVAVLYLGQIMETLPSDELLTAPLHPYTLALGRSYPAMNTVRDLGGIRGDAFYRLVHHHSHKDEGNSPHLHIQVPDSIHPGGHAPISGCLFGDRCTQAIEQCRRGRVDLEEIGTHTVRCLRHGIASVLELKGVSKTYGDVVALKTLDLKLMAGEALALVGETGSGKTTLAMIAAGVIRPDQGSRHFKGRDMDQWIKQDYKSLARQIGVIYQNPAESISHRFSVHEAVAEPLRIHGIANTGDERMEHVKASLEDVHLSTDPAFLKKYSSELNMGAIQRICLARALVLSPSMLIADEPTSSLDPSVQAKVLKLLLHLQIEMGLTLLFISHDIGLARKISDRIGVMLLGRILELGPASLILSRPRHPYTRLLIDSVSGLRMEDNQNVSNNLLPGGCPFASRCPRRREVCTEKDPPFRLIDQVRVACHFPLAQTDNGAERRRTNPPLRG